MITAAGNIRKIREGNCGKDCSTGRKGGRGVGQNGLTVPGVQRIPRSREPRKRPSDAPRQPRIHIGMWVLIKVPCDFRSCSSWRHGADSRYVGVIEQKRGDSYLVVTRIHGSFWATRKQMYARDRNGITWTTPLLVTEENEGKTPPGMGMVHPCQGPHSSR